MTRHPLNLLTAGSLVLCLATCVLWVRSGMTQDTVRRSIGDRRVYGVSSYRGALLLSRAEFLPHAGLPAFFSTVRWDADPVQPELGYDENGDSIDSIAWRKAGRLRLGYSAAPFFGGSASTVVVPFWLIASVMAILPAFLLFTRCRRGWRRSTSRCRSCGYDLTANVSGVCPECGQTTLSKGG